jgi:hypothetical protein
MQNDPSPGSSPRSRSRRRADGGRSGTGRGPVAGRLALEAVGEEEAIARDEEGAVDVELQGAASFVLDQSRDQGDAAVLRQRDAGRLKTNPVHVVRGVERGRIDTRSAEAGAIVARQEDEPHEHGTGLRLAGRKSKVGAEGIDSRRERNR